MAEGLRTGAMIKIGGKYAHACSYDAAVGKEARISESYVDENPYRLQGKHIMYYVREIHGRTWEIHSADAIPLEDVTNQSLKGLLDKEW